MMLKRSVCVLAAVLCFASVAFAAGGLVNADVKRVVELTSSLASSTATVEVRNDGSSPVSKYEVVVPGCCADKLAFVAAWDAEENDFDVTEGKTDDSGAHYTVELAEALQPGDSVVINVYQVYMHTMRPYPEEIRQNEHQLVVYSGPASFVSPYASESTVTEFKLASNLVESFTDDESVEPVAVAGDTVTYGPYSDVAANSIKTVSIHFGNQKAFVLVNKLTRAVEVSHWGNVAIENWFEVSHVGAKLKGSFSRYDYQRNPMASGSSSVRSLKLTLPVGTADVYYRDEIGNISTSNLWIEDDDSAILDVRPRYPLFGGWRSAFLIGYNLPLSNHLATDDSTGEFVLTVPFTEQVEDTPADEVVVRVILPEGSSDIRVESPVKLDGEVTFERHFTFLDTQGRPVVVFKSSSIVPDHDSNFVVRYNFSGVTKFREPLMLVAAFFVFFFVCIVYVRLEFSITPTGSNDERALLDAIVRLHDNRVSEYDSLDSALRSSSSRDFAVARKAALDRLKTIESEFNACIDRLSSLNESAAARARNVATKEVARSTLVKELQQLHRSFENKDMKQAKYDKASSAKLAELETIESEIDRIIDDFRDA